MSVERGLALLLAIAVYAAFELERWWLARVIALALGAMLLALEVRAVHEKYLERKLRREAAASCEAKGSVLVVGAIANEFVCLMRRGR